MGGGFVAHDATIAQEVQFTALLYVSEKIFIVLNYSNFNTQS